MTSIEPIWANGIKIVNPLTTGEGNPVDTVTNGIKAVKPAIQKEIEVRRDVIRKGRVWYEESKKTNPVNLIPGILSPLSSEAIKSLALNDLDAVEKKHFFRFLVMHPIHGDIYSLGREVSRILNKPELVAMNEKSHVVTACLFFTHLPEEIELIQQIAGFMNTMVAFFSNSPGLQALLIKAGSNPNLHGFINSKKDELMEDILTFSKEPLIQAINDPKTVMNTIIQDKDAVGRFLKKTQTAADLIKEEAKAGKLGGVFDAVPTKKKKKSLFDPKESTLDDGSNTKISTTTTTPVNKWIKTDKINNILLSVSSAMADLEVMVGWGTNVLNFANGAVDFTLNAAEKLTQTSQTLTDNVLDTSADFIEKVSNIGSETQFTSLIIPPTEPITKPELTALIQNALRSEKAPFIPANSTIYGAMVLCYTESTAISNLAFSAIKLLLGGKDASIDQ